MKHIAIIGTGRHGSRYADHICHDIGGLHLAGIWRRSPEGKRQAERWSTSFFDDWREMVALPEVDAVVGVVPPSMNLEIARVCADHQKPLLLEKPLARNSAEAGEILQILHSTGVPLTVGQTLRYNPVIQALSRRLPEMGELYSFAANQRLEPSRLAWHDERDTAGAGVLFHTAVHMFDALKVITNVKVKRVLAQGRQIHARVLEDLVAVMVELENGVLGTVDVSKVGQARTGRFEFVCRDGQLHGEQIHGYLEVIEGNALKMKQDFAQRPAVLYLLKDWQAFLEGQGTNPISGEDGLYAVQVCEACLISMQEERWVELE
jgi:predicted dehydrogenase